MRSRQTIRAQGEGGGVRSRSAKRKRRAEMESDEERAGRWGGDVERINREYERF